MSVKQIMASANTFIIVASTCLFLASAQFYPYEPASEHNVSSLCQQHLDLYVEALENNISLTDGPDWVLKSKLSFIRCIK